MSKSHIVNTTWIHGMQFESSNPSQKSVFIDLSPENGGRNEGLHPKAMMLSALAGCTGVDVIMILNKMKAEFSGFRIETIGNLVGSPEVYDKVEVIYHFYGSDFDKPKFEKSVNLSVDKYCGVLEMFRKFAEVKIRIEYHEI